MSEISEQAVNAALEKAVEFMHFPILAIDADMRREFKEILVAAFEAQPQQDSPLIALLKAGKTAVNVNNLDNGSWAYWSNGGKEWVVRLGAITIAKTTDEAEAAKAWAGE